MPEYLEKFENGEKCSIVHLEYVLSLDNNLIPEGSIALWKDALYIAFSLRIVDERISEDINVQFDIGRLVSYFIGLNKLCKK